MKKILIIDDEPEMLQSLRKILSQRNDFDISLMQNAAEALKHVTEQKYDLILTDLNMGEVSGIDLLRAALGKFPDTKVCVISGYGTIEASVEAMQEGATDFIEKPFTSKKLYDCIDSIFESMPDEDSSDISVSNEAADESNLVYKSSEMKSIVTMAKKVAGSDVNVLITGESGTGKELIARAIHNLSNRRTNPFVPVNCGALPENLFESEIFGHEKGAFTGAIRTKPGLLEFANQGSFFLDEIGDMSLALQVKLLRMLEERKIRRVGGQKLIDIDVRIIAATNQDLSQAVGEKKIREDLYYRINTIQIAIPPLRERPDDILLLAHHFLNILCTKNDKAVNRFSSDAEDSLLKYGWPGNVRELQNMISRAFYLCSSRVIQKGDLPLTVSGQAISLDDKMFDLSYKEAKDYVLEKFEIEYLTHKLRHFNGNISQAAANCGIDRRSIHRLINKYKIIYHD